MDTQKYTLATLFAELGLANDEQAISEFIYRHKHLEDDINIVDAKFWSPSQKKFLRSAQQSDSNWLPIVNQLNTLLKL